MNVLEVVCKTDPPAFPLISDPSVFLSGPFPFVQMSVSHRLVRLVIRVCAGRSGFPPFPLWERLGKITRFVGL